MNPLGLLDAVQYRAALPPPAVPLLTTAPEDHSCVCCQRDFPCADLECLGLTFTICPPCRKARGLAA
ncbi:MAG: hypothetical protein KIT14_22650 [bacterium]|nr:hypothetical protein [bacterium]